MIIMAANPVIHSHMDDVDGPSLSSSRRNSLDEFKRLEKEVQQEELSSEEVDYNSSSSVVSGPPNTGVNMNNVPKHTFSTANTSVHNSPQQSLVEQEGSTASLAGSPRGGQQPDGHLAEAPAFDLIYGNVEKVNNDSVKPFEEDEEVVKQSEEGVGSIQNLKLVDDGANKLEMSLIAADDASSGNPRIVEDSLSTAHVNTTLIPTTEVSQHFESTTPELSIQDQNQQQFEEEEDAEQECGEKCQSPAANRSYSLAACPSSPTSDTLSINQSKTKSTSLTPVSNKNCKCESIKKILS